MKKKILYWADSPTVNTGFGTASKYILSAIYSTGKYDIDILGINYHGEFYPREEYPYQIVPSSYGNPNDPYGLHKFTEIIQKTYYHYIFIQNDTFVIEPITKALEQVINLQRAANITPTKIIYYYPIDCNLHKEYSSLIEIADLPLTYSKFGVKETLKILPSVKNKLKNVYLGTNSKTYFPLSLEQKRQWRKEYFGIEDDNTCLVINVNRNSRRKQLALSLLAFKEFRKKVPNSIMYLHTNPKSNNINLIVACKDLGLNPVKDVVFPKHYNPKNGFPEKVLNRIYNSGDIYLTTHVGEGFGLTIAEAMAAGLPVVAPDNTNMNEFDGVHLIPCSSKTYIDNSGYRLMVSPEDTAEKMFYIWDNRNEGDPGFKDIQEKRKLALNWARKYSWNNLKKIWIELFDILEKEEQTNNDRENIIRGEHL